jgi:hypothetical protein
MSLIYHNEFISSAVYVCKYTKASLSGGFMIQFSTHPYFRNSAEEFHPHETLSTLMNFHYLSLSMQCHVRYLMPVKFYETPIKIGLMMLNLLASKQARWVVVNAFHLFITISLHRDILVMPFPLTSVNDGLQQLRAFTTV